MKIVFASSALEDLDKIKQYYNRELIPEVGLKFVTAIVEHIESLVEHPDIGRVVPEFDEVTLRELIHAPFRIVYLRESETIQIIRVWRSERLLVLLGEDE